MRNPAREQLLERLAIATRFKDLPMMEMCNFGIRAIDLRDALQAAIEIEGRDEGVTADGYPYWIAGRIREEIKKFDGGDDEQNHDHAGVWGGGRTR